MLIALHTALILVETAVALHAHPPQLCWIINMFEQHQPAKTLCRIFPAMCTSFVILVKAARPEHRFKRDHFDAMSSLAATSLTCFLPAPVSKGCKEKEQLARKIVSKNSLEWQNLMLICAGRQGNSHSWLIQKVCDALHSPDSQSKLMNEVSLTLVFARCFLSVP